MASVEEAYNSWAAQYDTNDNKTRDMEASVLRASLSTLSFKTCLEIGCGTGKNTEWLVTKADQITAVDLSENMLSLAKAKIISDKVRFAKADITKDWEFAKDCQFDLVVFSLVLEHIENLESLFRTLNQHVKAKGYVYVGELHPFKQYTGSKARFETQNGLEIVTCFNHHISDFTSAAKRNGFNIVDISESFDNGDKAALPRLLMLLFQKE